MIIRRLFWVAAISAITLVAAYAIIAIVSQVYTASVLAGWEEERSNRTGSIALFPTQGEDQFHSAITLGFAPLCILPPMSSVIGFGPTVIQREDPITLPDGRAQIPTEMVEMTLQGVLFGGSLMGPVTIRESPDRPSPGNITELEAGTDFPAESFFDVFIEVDIPGGITLINNDPIPMRRIHQCDTAAVDRLSAAT